MSEASANASGKELLDATQEAVIGAADNVGKALHEATVEIEDAAHQEEFFYQSPEFWVGVSCLLAIAVLVAPVKKMMLQFFEKRRQGIIKRIDEAEALKNEARELLAAYEEKLENIADETGKIVKKAQREASHLKKTGLEGLERSIAAREKYVEEKIANSRNQVTSQIVAHTAEKTITALRQALAEKLSAPAQRRLIDESIDWLQKLK